MMKSILVSLHLNHLFIRCTYGLLHTLSIDFGPQYVVSCIVRLKDNANQQREVKFFVKRGIYGEGLIALCSEKTVCFYWAQESVWLFSIHLASQMSQHFWLHLIRLLLYLSQWHHRCKASWSPAWGKDCCKWAPKSMCHSDWVRESCTWRRQTLKCADTHYAIAVFAMNSTEVLWLETARMCNSSLNLICAITCCALVSLELIEQCLKIRIMVFRNEIGVKRGSQVLSCTVTPTDEKVLLPRLEFCVKFISVGAGNKVILGRFHTR